MFLNLHSISRGDLSISGTQETHIFSSFPSYHKGECKLGRWMLTN